MKKLIALMIAFSVVLALFACGQKPKTAADWLSLGEKYLLELDYEQAIAALDEAIKIEPKEPRIRVEKIIVYVLADNPAGAQQTQQQAQNDDVPGFPILPPIPDNPDEFEPEELLRPVIDWLRDNRLIDTLAAIIDMIRQRWPNAFLAVSATTMPETTEATTELTTETNTTAKPTTATTTTTTGTTATTKPTTAPAIAVRTYTVRFYECVNNDGTLTQIATRSVEAGKCLSDMPPTVGNHDGSEFAGWYTSQAASATTVTLSTPITSDMTLYAKWKQIPVTTSKLIRNGYYEVQYSNGTYKGNFVNDKRHGYGEYYWNTGDVYKGNWANDQKSGSGKMTWANGTYYDGQYQNDVFSGYGVKDYGGMRYEGYWSNGKANGQGIMISSNGITAEGNFTNGVLNGRIKVTFEDGGYSYAQYENGIGECNEVYDRYGNLTGERKHLPYFTIN